MVSEHTAGRGRRGVDRLDPQQVFISPLPGPPSSPRGVDGPARRRHRGGKKFKPAVHPRPPAGGAPCSIQRSIWRHLEVPVVGCGLGAGGDWRRRRGGYGYGPMGLGQTGTKTLGINIRKHLAKNLSTKLKHDETRNTQNWLKQKAIDLID